MRAPFTKDDDPWHWCAVIAIFFFALAWHRLGIPSQIYFDEVHYVPAARKMLEWTSHNPEHPLLAKQVLAAAIWLGGDAPLVWRIPSLLFGTLGLYAFARFVWFTTGLKQATILAVLLLATNFAWFVQSRIAMLDMVMAGLAMGALWMCAAAVRQPQQARWRLALAGVLFGLALGAKWSVAPLLVVPGLVFLALKLKHTGRRFLLARDGGPVPGMTLVEAGVWLGLVPLAVYWATFWPAFTYKAGAIDPLAPLKWHRYMLDLQDSVKKPHPYRTEWYQWVGNVRGIWYLYQPVDGPAHRGILLIGNPFTMLAGLPALVWALWAGIWRRRYDALTFAGLYLVTLGLWVVSTKPIQFYYHYLLPSTFLMGCLALALDDLWRRGGRLRWAMPGAVLASLAMFAWFYPIISAAKLCCGRPSFTYWMWLTSWR